MHAHRPITRGFTLVEQIIVLAIVAILIGAAVPSMSGLLHRNQARVAVDALTRALHAARFMAIERERRSLLCPSSDGRRCTGGHEWQGGWLIAFDGDDDGQPDGVPVHIQPALHGVRILGSRNRTHVRYHANGSAPGSNLTLIICPVGKKPATVRSIVVSNAGRIRFGKVSGRACSGS